jgi:hypothetical protein
METSDRILKRDAAGRVWTPREQREAALDAFERSGLPARQFAAQIGVKYATFANWVAKRRQQRQEVARRTGSEGGALGWVEATVETPAARSGGALVVHVPGGARLEISEAAQVILAAHLLRALREGALTC